MNYQEREERKQTYTSQAAESHIESIISARRKRSGMMQWTREGAHNGEHPTFAAIPFLLSAEGGGHILTR